MAETPAPTASEWTIGKLLAWTKSHFESAGIEDARLCAELLLAKALGCRRIELYTQFERSPSDEHRAAYRELVRAAADHKPIAYLIGSKEFYSLEFQVTPDVLIPRPETELLVEKALCWCKEHPAERHEILDVGTGSGCIAVAIAKRLATARVIASDISPAALLVAKANAAKHGVSERVQIVEANLLDFPADAPLPPGGFDVIVSNPPYISEDDRDSVQESVARYEPAVALYSADGGLAAYHGIAAGLARVLKAGGTLIVEVGAGQAQAVSDLFTNSGGLELVGRFKDLAGMERALQFMPRAGGGPYA